MATAKKAATKSVWLVLKGVPSKVVHDVFDDEKKAVAAAEELVAKGEAEFTSIEHRIVPSTAKDKDDAKGTGSKAGE